MYFNYSENETEYLKSKCKKLSCIIDKIGHIEREVDKDLFSAVVQISNKAQVTIWKSFQDNLKNVNAYTLINAGIENLQALGISYKKAQYILDFSKKVKDGEFDLESIREKTDEEVIKELSSLKGIGIWTA